MRVFEHILVSAVRREGKLLTFLAVDGMLTNPAAASGIHTTGYTFGPKQS